MSNVAYANFAAHSAVRSNRMENQKTGFIPLYRSVLKQPGRKMFPAHVGKPSVGAARQPYSELQRRQWPLQTGQLVTTSADLGLNLCDREGSHAVATLSTECWMFSSGRDDFPLWREAKRQCDNHHKLC
jgi:hypothetical protein